MTLPTLYVIIRRDLPLASQGVQAGHAVAEWCKIWATSRDGNLLWSNQRLIYVTISDLSKLEFLMLRIQDRDVAFTAFKEPDLDNQITAIACLSDSLEASKMLSKLPLWLK